MSVSALTGAPASAASTADIAASKLTENFDTFLKLLTTQLQNQDPLSPMESSEFVNQLVQFTEAEQAIATNKKLEQLLEVQTQNQTTAGLGYIGNTVEFVGDEAPLQNGKAEFVYALEKQEATTIVITDKNGIAVATAPGGSSIGRNTFTWDGKLSDGSDAPPGVYKIIVRGADGNKLDIATAGVGKVTGLETGSGGLTLALDDVRALVEDVIAVRAPAPSAS